MKYMWLVGQDLRVNSPLLLSLKPFLPFIYFRFHLDLRAPAFTLFCLHLIEAYLETVITDFQEKKKRKKKCLTEEKAALEAGFSVQEVNRGRKTNLLSAEQRRGQQWKKQENL